MRWAWIMVGLKSSNTFLEEIHKKKHKREGHVKAEREKEIRITLCVILGSSVMFDSGEGDGTPLQYSCPENPMDGEAWQAQSMGSQRVRHDWSTSFTFHFLALGKEMATHSSVIAWRIPGTGEPGGLPSVGSHRLGYDWSDLVAAAACLTLCHPVDCRPPSSSVHAILQARILECAAMPFSRRSSQPRDQTKSPALPVDFLPGKLK